MENTLNDFVIPQYKQPTAYLTKTQVCRLCKIHFGSLQKAIHYGKLPEPTRFGGRCYAPKDVRKIVAYFANPLVKAGFLTKKQAAKALGISVGHLVYEIEAGRIAPPSHILETSRKYYTKAEVRAMRKHFRNRDSSATGRSERRRKDGYYSINDVAKLCGVGAITISYHIGVGRIAPPSHKVEGWPSRCYYRSEVEEIRKMLRERKGFFAVAKRGPRVKIGKPVGVAVAKGN